MSNFKMNNQQLQGRFYVDTYNANFHFHQCFRLISDSHMKDSETPNYGGPSFNAETPDTSKGI
jgi:hypothetical protein